jgi:hypothetical protein
MKNGMMGIIIEREFGLAGMKVNPELTLFTLPECNFIPA